MYILKFILTFRLAMDARLHQKTELRAEKPTLSESSKNIAIDTKIFGQNFGVNSYIFAALTQGWFFRPEFCFLMKPGVHCQAKRQNKFENIHLFIIYRQNTKQRKFSLASLAYHAR